MKLQGKVLVGNTTTLQTKAGKALEKTRLKVQDVGEETGGDLLAYWIDFLGESALTENQIATLLHEEVEIDIRRVGASSGKQGGAFLNMTGGAIYVGGQQFQSMK